MTFFTILFVLLIALCELCQGEQASVRFVSPTTTTTTTTETKSSYAGDACLCALGFCAPPFTTTKQTNATTLFNGPSTAVLFTIFRDDENQFSKDVPVSTYITGNLEDIITGDNNGNHASVAARLSYLTLGTAYTLSASGDNDLATIMGATHLSGNNHQLTYPSIDNVETLPGVISVSNNRVELSPEISEITFDLSQPAIRQVFKELILLERFVSNLVASNIDPTFGSFALTSIQNIDRQFGADSRNAQAIRSLVNHNLEHSFQIFMQNKVFASVVFMNSQSMTHFRKTLEKQAVVHGTKVLDSSSNTGLYQSMIWSSIGLGIITIIVVYIVAGVGQDATKDTLLYRTGIDLGR